MPRNYKADCEKQFKGSKQSEAGFAFCKCIHNEGNSLQNCLEKYKKTINNIEE